MREVADVLRQATNETDILGKYSPSCLIVMREFISDEETEKWVNDLFSNLMLNVSTSGITYRIGIYNMMILARDILP